jgi:hypothetical protein
MWEPFHMVWPHKYQKWIYKIYILIQLNELELVQLS